MPLYEVPRVELHVRPMLVVASCPNAARDAVRKGRGVPVGPPKFEQIGCALFRPEPAKAVRNHKDYYVLGEGVSSFNGEQACTSVYEAVSEGDPDDVAEALSRHLSSPVRVSDMDDPGKLSHIFCFGQRTAESEIEAVREAAGKGKS